MEETKTYHWSCNTCGQQEGVENGVCPKCGATQTIPLSDQAKEEADVLGERSVVSNDPEEAKRAAEAKERDDHSRLVAEGKA